MSDLDKQKHSMPKNNTGIHTFGFSYLILICTRMQKLKRCTEIESIIKTIRQLAHLCRKPELAVDHVMPTRVT